MKQIAQLIINYKQVFLSALDRIPIIIENIEKLENYDF